MFYGYTALKNTLIDVTPFSSGRRGSPHRFPDKYLIKGLNGWNHSVAFTLGNFLEPIRITPLNRQVTQETCLYCHASLVVAISQETGPHPTDCLTCHAGVGHER